MHDDEWKKLWFQFWLNRLDYVEAHIYHLNIAQYTLLSLSVAFGSFSFVLFTDYLTRGFVLLALIFFQTIASFSIHHRIKKERIKRAVILKKLKKIFIMKDMNYNDLMREWSVLKKRINK